MATKSKYQLEAIKLGTALHEFFLAQGWKNSELLNDFHDEDLREHVENTDFKTHQIRRIIQNIVLNPKIYKEENVMSENTNVVSVKVPNKGFSETTVKTFNGQDLSKMSEEELYSSLQHILDQHEKLVTLNEKVSSKRIGTKINNLVNDRIKLVDYIDSLQED